MQSGKGSMLFTWSLFACSQGADAGMATVLRAWRYVLRPEESQCGLDELRGGVEEDRPMTAIGHNPERGARNGACAPDNNRRSFDSLRSLRMTPPNGNGPTLCT